MPNVESVRIVDYRDHYPAIVVHLYHPFCWRGQFWGDADLVETDGALRCSECRGRLDRND